MIVKLIPESEEEKKAYENKGIAEMVHEGVKEFMLFGNKIDADGDLADFHEWHGSYRYLMGSLQYFYDVVNDNRKNQNVSSGSFQTATLTKPMLVKRGNISPNVHAIDVSNLQVNEDDAFGDEENNEIQNCEIDIEDIENQADKIRSEQAFDNEIRNFGLKIIK